MSLPNTYNISFDFQNVILFMIPTVYVLFFPQLYGHMWVQRKKHYQAFAKEKSMASLIVPEQFKVFKNLEGVKKLCPVG